MTVHVLQDTSPPEPFWIGNAAKSQIISEIIPSASSDNLLVILDYGCGTGGDWPLILEAHPNIKLYGFEPDRKAARIAEERLSSHNFTMLTAEQLEGTSIQADFIVSFSVFEHVYDRLRFLELGKIHLGANGKFYLNYDDGHFRNSLDCDRLSEWPKVVRRVGQNLLVPLLARLGRLSSYQSRVHTHELEKMLRSVGLEIVEVTYGNLSCFKQLSKTLPHALQDEFCLWWREVERTLNDRFNQNCKQPFPPGDSSNLWGCMPTKTYLLTKTDLN